MITNGQRALWTLLIYALVGPLFAALMLVIVIALGSVLGLSGLLPAELPPLPQVGLVAFVWSTVPAVLTAIVLATVVWRAGDFTWLVAVIVAVIAFAIAAMLLPLDLDHARPYLAFLAGIVATMVRQVLVQIDVIAP